MSLMTGSLSDKARLIAPESSRLLREARRLRKQGYGKASEEMMMAGTQMKLGEGGGIKSAEDKVATQKLSEQMDQAKIRSVNEAGQGALQGRIGFAQSIEERAKTMQPGENIYEKAQAEAPKFGVTPAQLTGFFKRKGLSFGSAPKPL